MGTENTIIMTVFAWIGIVAIAIHVCVVRWQAGEEAALVRAVPASPR